MILVVFFATVSGNEPSREWIKKLSTEEKQIVGADLRTVQFGFPMGMPLCKPLRDGLCEVRSSLPSGNEARILFSHEPMGLLVLHGFIKKSQRTPPAEIELALRRRDEYRSRQRRGGQR